MAEVTRADIPVEAEFMPVFWKLVKKFWIPEDNELYWADFYDAINAVWATYQTEFCRDVIIMFIEYLDKKAKKEKKRKDTARRLLGISKGGEK